MTGDTSQGLHLTLASAREVYPSHTLPAFEAAITNVSDELIVFCIYLLEHRLLTSMVSNGYQVFPLDPTVERPLSADDYLEMHPGHSFKVSLDLTQAAQNCYWFVYAGGLPMEVDFSYAVLGFPPGSYSFRTFLDAQVPVYLPPAGVHRPGPLRKLWELGPRQDIWKGELAASCSVRFEDE